MRERLAQLIVDHRHIIAILVLVAALVCTALIPRVAVNNDLTEYLPDSSPMRQGVDLMEREFPDVRAPSTIRAMFDGLTDEERQEVADNLANIPGVDEVAYELDSDDYNQGEHALFVISTSLDYDSPGEVAIERAVEGYYDERGGTPAGVSVSVMNDGVASAVLSPWLIGGAVGLLVLILVAMSQSWVEPLLYLLAIGCAVGINMGTNIVQGQIAQVTFSIGAILQLVLSMDYSIVLMNRYRQELAARGVDIAWHSRSHGVASGAADVPAGLGDQARVAADTPELRREAMRDALAGAFTAIASSSLTTFVGLLALVFMTFKIGGDLGVVLAKGVIVSFACVITLLPALILAAHRAIAASAKPVPRPRLAGLAHLEHRFRWVLTAGFVALFVVALVVQGQTQVSYTLDYDDPIAEVFPRTTQVVVLYDNADEDAMAQIVAELEGDARVREVTAWSNTLGKPLTQDELVEAVEQLGAGGEAGGGALALGGGTPDSEDASSVPAFDTSQIGMLFSTYQRKVDPDAEAISISELVRFLNEDVLTDKLMGAFIKGDQREAIADLQVTLDEAKAQMVGPDHSIVAVTVDSATGSEEASSLMDDLAEVCDSCLTGDHYLVGDVAMVREMRLGFAREMLTITLVSATAIFLVVALAFRSLAVPLILVLVVQCGVYLTIVAIGLQGLRMYYLAMLIVQCILMGATIDYGILFTSNYREARREKEPREALVHAYDSSIHTIMTSGLIIILVTAVIAASGTEPTIAQICGTISMGAASAVILILLFLPALLVALDRFTGGRNRS